MIEASFSNIEIKQYNKNLLFEKIIKFVYLQTLSYIFIVIIDDLYT
jgi:hypothetical protein